MEIENSCPQLKVQHFKVVPRRTDNGVAGMGFPTQCNGWRKVVGKVIIGGLLDVSGRAEATPSPWLLDAEKRYDAEGKSKAVERRREADDKDTKSDERPVSVN